MTNNSQLPATLVNFTNNTDDDISVAPKPLPAEQFYVSQGCSLKGLIILCKGMKDKSGAPLVDPALPPCNSMLKSGSMKPTAKELRAEVVHCASLDDMISNCPPPSKAMDYFAGKIMVEHAYHHHRG